MIRVGRLVIELFVSRLVDIESPRARGYVQSLIFERHRVQIDQISEQFPIACRQFGQIL